MKLKEGFITHQTGDEQIMVSAGNTKFNGLVRSNSTAAFIVDCLKSDTTENEIVSKMLKKYDAPEEVLSSDVKKIIDKLRSIGAIDE
ncbi:PqqD family protein [Porcipelethomonas sp.]|uniref:PqqD family protein n=1 Tax=Porcipelethomonas sp. TaxID=2981675 RepID=UPI003EF868FF